MATLLRCSSIFLVAFSILFHTVLSLTQDDHHHATVLTLELIHRDSPVSPLYNPSETHWQRLSQSLRRSHHQHRIIPHFRGKDVESPLSFSGGEYLLNISIGTPPRTLIGIFDTGSNLIWTQCIPCKECFEQKTPLFNPASSQTYKALSCGSKQCHLLPQASCFSTQLCHYNYTYGDGSYTIGNLALDTVTLNSISVRGTIFGCGHQNGGIFSGIESGIIGFGSGAVSLVSQIGKSVGGKFFSHCLVPTMSTQTDPNISSKLYFGHQVSGPGVLSTPLLLNGIDTYYYLELQGISVGGKRFTIDVDSSQDFKGNIFIDSGTPITYLPTNLYTSFEAEIRKEVHLEVVKDSMEYYLLNLCYKTMFDITDPIVTVHFNGADVKLNLENTFLRVSEDVVCLAFGPTSNETFTETSDLGIYGNVAVTNFLVEYDLENKILSFKPTNCTAQ
ncbi:hypothetical protein M0R45_035354 [Rubus argutus]|uniref:Peptidase A1 domain-containing protein n=1 Tax=Rubus argutus TaxID=59490 RepID=A0AAW1VUD9_RUBAR